MDQVEERHRQVDEVCYHKKVKYLITTDFVFFFILLNKMKTDLLKVYVLRFLNFLAGKRKETL